jgi:dihydropteroate synthase
MRPVFEWNLGSRSLQLGKRTLVMGVVNVTPDSFSDGGVHLDHDRSLQYALKLLDDGADIALL